MALTNKDNHKDNYEEIFEELVKERFDEIKELTDELNQNNLIYYFKGNTFRKRLDDFNNGIELLKKIKSGEMKLEKAKNLQNVFKSNLNEISRGRFESEDQKKMHLKILNYFTNHEKLLSIYLMIILQLYLRLNTNQFMEKSSKR